MDALSLHLRLDPSPYDDLGKAVGNAVVDAVQKKHPALEGLNVNCRYVELDAKTGEGEVVVTVPVSEHEGIAELAEAVERTGLAAHEEATDE